MRFPELLPVHRCEWRAPPHGMTLAASAAAKCLLAETAGPPSTSKRRRPPTSLADGCA